MAEEKVQVPDGETEQTVTEEAQEQTTATEKSKSKTEKKSKKLEGQIAELERQLEEKNAEIAAQNDRYLRMMAEYDNFRKRSAKEREGIYADAYADALTSILPIIDNLERAVGFTEADQVQKGVEMILKSAGDVLSKMGVEAFGAKGDIFDPNMHNAVMHIDDEEHKEGEIVEVFQKGYKKGDKIIRYAMVQTAN